MPIPTMSPDCMRSGRICSSVSSVMSGSPSKFAPACGKLTMLWAQDCSIYMEATNMEKVEIVLELLPLCPFWPA